MLDIDDVMNDVREAVEFSLNDRVIRVEDIVDKVRALVLPVLESQQHIISRRDMQIVDLEQDIYECHEEITDLEHRIKDRETEDERQALIRFFQHYLEPYQDKTEAYNENRQEVIRQLNIAAQGEAVYS